MNTLNTIPQNSPCGPPHFVSAAAIAICTAGYGLLSMTSRSDSGTGLWTFLGIFWMMALTTSVYWWVLTHKKQSPGLFAVIFAALIFRLIGVYGFPVLEDDFYRYLLDGCVFAATGSPYGIAPESLFAGGSLPAECNSALTRVNNPDIPTVYGPVLQYIFLLAHIISPGNITMLQFILIVFDLGVICILAKSVSARNLILYAWNPLVIKEIAFTAHPDIIGIFFLAAAFFASSRGRAATASVCIAMACAAKIFAFILLPFFLWKKSAGTWLLIIFVLLGLYLPFAVKGQTDLPVLRLFIEHWQFNGALFALAQSVSADRFARFFCLAAFLGCWLFYFYRFQRFAAFGDFPRVERILGLFLFFSPVINAWYVIWLLPFAVMGKCSWPWALSLAVSLSYAVGLNMPDSALGAYQIAPWAYTLQWMIVAVALYRDCRNDCFKINSG